MRYIEDLRDIHLGEEIWVVGCGGSLDDFPEDFFSNKVFITLNDLYLLLPDCTFNCSIHAHVGRDIKRTNPGLLERSILCYPQFTEETAKTQPAWNGDNEAYARKWDLNWIGCCGEESIYMKWYDSHPFPPIDEIERRLRVVAESIINKTPTIYLSLNTVSHTAIQAAMVMGAKKITLAGCDEAATRDGYHVCKKLRRLIAPEYAGKVEPDELGRERQNSIGAWPIRSRYGTKCLVKIFQSYGFDIQKYFIGEGYRKIV